MADKEVERVWNDFWKPLLTKEGYGVSLDLIKRELFDYYKMLDNVPKVYMAVTGGLLSKPNYDAATVISVYEDQLNKHVEECVQDALEDYDRNDYDDGTDYV